MRTLAFYAVLFALVPVVVFTMANDMVLVSNHDQALASIEEQLKKGKDPTVLLAAPAAGVRHCDNEAFLYGKSSGGYAFVMPYAESLLAASRGDEVVIMEWDKLGYHASELRNVGDRGSEAKRLEAMLKACMASDKYALQTGIRLYFD